MHEMGISFAPTFLIVRPFQTNLLRGWTKLSVCRAHIIHALLAVSR